MGAKEVRGNYHIPDNNDIEMLEKDIERFCNDNQDKIKNIYLIPVRVKSTQKNI